MIKPHRTDLAGKLRTSQRKLTGPRREILQLLEQQEHPLTTRKILDLLPPGSCDLATVYRAMHLLETLKLVRRFDFGDGRSRFELVRDEKGGHHHHLICTECALIIEVEDCFPKGLEQRVAEGNGFKQITHKLEFFGICPGCQAK